MQRRQLWVLGAPALGACATPPQTAALRELAPPGLPRQLELLDTPFHAQTRAHCGPAALATVLNHAGLPASPDALADAVFLPGRGGSLQLEMLAGARRFGGVATRLPAELAALLLELQAGHPVLLLQNLGLAWAPVWHYAVLVGYALDTETLVLRSGTQARERMSLRTFELTWARAGHWAITVLPPGQLPTTASEAEQLQAAIGFERVAPPAQAVAAYRVLHARWPRNLVAAIGLGNALKASGRLDEARATFAEAARRHDSAMAWINLGQMELESGHLEPARAAAREALRRAQHSEPRWLGHAQHLAHQLLQATGAMP